MTDNPDILTPAQLAYIRFNMEHCPDMAPWFRAEQEELLRKHEAAVKQGGKL